MDILQLTRGAVVLLNLYLTYSYWRTNRPAALLSLAAAVQGSTGVAQ